VKLRFLQTKVSGRRPIWPLPGSLLLTTGLLLALTSCGRKPEPQTLARPVAEQISETLQSLSEPVAVSGGAVKDENLPSAQDVGHIPANIDLANQSHTCSSVTASILAEGESKYTPVAATVSSSAGTGSAPADITSATIVTTLLSANSATEAKRAVVELLEDEPVLIGEMGEAARILIEEAQAGDSETIYYLDALVAIVAGLAEIGSPTAVLEIVSLLNGISDDTVKRQAVELANGIVNPASVPLLFEVLCIANDPDLATIARESLAGMEGEAVCGEVLNRYITAENDADAIAYLSILRCMHGDVVVATLTDVLADGESSPDTALFNASVDTLALNGTPEAVEFLIELMTNDPDSESHVASAVARVVNPDAVALLIETAESTSASEIVRRAAVTALGNFSSNDVQDLLQTLSETDTQIQQTAQAALARSFGEHPDDFTD